jgi:uncharacterized OB-fold protein
LKEMTALPMHESSSLATSALGVGDDGQPVLIGAACNACSTRIFPAARVCPVCMSEDVSLEEMSREGTLYSFTIVHIGPTSWVRPFALGYIDLTNGVRVFSHLAGKSFKIGASVKLAIGKIGTNADGSEINTFVFQSAEG